MFDSQLNSDENLKKVFDIYKTAGILDENVIVENIAFFALLWYFRNDIELQGKIFAKGLDPKLENLIVSRREVDRANNELEDFLRQRRSGLLSNTRTYSPVPYSHFDINDQQISNVAALLFEIFRAQDHLDSWFDRILIPYLNANTRGGRYATPRHLVDFMTGIARISPNDSLADFACGTGGMLVAKGLVKHVTGIEISPNMARLAYTNLVLHGQEQQDIYLSNAFDIANNDSKFIESKFDVIVMNPPFGVRVESNLILRTSNDSIPDAFKGNSETMFTALAYEKLKRGGRMVVLVPSGVLFSNSSGEVFLRRLLVEAGALQAVISLPKDSMQPVNNLSTHVLYGVKPEKEEDKNSGVWFYRPRYDGFRGGRNRQPDPEHNDLPLVEAAISLPGTADVVQVIPLTRDNKILGYRLECAEGVDILVEKLDNFFWIFANNNTQSLGRITIHDTQIQPLEPISGKRLFGHTIFKSDTVRRGIVLDENGEIVGVQVAQKAVLDTKGGELQSERYWVEKRSTAVPRSAAQILGDIKRNQNKLTSTLDRLLSISETQAVANGEFPPHVKVIVPSQDLVQGIQQSVMEIVLKQVEQSGDYETPTPFQADDIHSKLGDNASVMDVQRTLELFERMGLIVSVTYEGVPYYRLPIERDIVTESGK